MMVSYLDAISVYTGQRQVDLFNSCGGEVPIEGRRSGNASGFVLFSSYEDSLELPPST